jgi:hypothetical protein
MSEGRKSRWNPRRFLAAALALAALASAGTACAYVARVWPFSPIRPCSQLVSLVRTSESSYASGQTVSISLTVANKGPACSTPPEPCITPPAASAYNSAGKDVWDDGAAKFAGVPTCMVNPPPQVWPANYSNTQKLDWSEDRCTAGPLGGPNPNCPGTRVAAGTYRIAGGTGRSESAIITISG